MTTSTLKGFYAIGILAADVESYSAVSLISNTPVDMAVNELGGLAVKSSWCIVTLVKDGYVVTFKATKGSLVWMGEKNV